jgi:hypothetical protein
VSTDCGKFSFAILDVFAAAAFEPGEVSEWLKEHAWKACTRQNWVVGSNPTLSASPARVASATQARVFHVYLWRTLCPDSGP